MVEKIPNKQNFSEWYDFVLSYAEICDIRYPSKGMPVYPWYGYQIFENMIRYLEKLLNETNHKKVWFPVFIPEEIFAKEAEHIKGFWKEVFIVERAGDNKLERKLIVRPTSETELYYMFSIWVKSYKDLPIKIYMSNTVYRYETKATRPLIRVREILWNEAHTAHSSKEEALKQLEEAREIYEKLYDFLCIKDCYLIVKRPNYDKFAGAEFSIAFDGFMPNSKRLQIGTIHYLGQKFAKAFEIKFLNEKNEYEYTYQTCYGVSIRTVAYMLSILGDNRGLVLPPTVAPIKIVIVPIWYNEEEKEKILKVCKDVREKLLKSFKEGKLREYLVEWNQSFYPDLVVLDTREDKKPVEKFWEWEIKGVPIRVEVGAKDLKEGKVTIFRRDLLKKEKVKIEEIESRIYDLIREILENLRKKSKEYFYGKIKEANSLEEAIRLVEEGYIVKIPICDPDNEEHGDYLKEKYSIEIWGTKYPEPEKAEGKKCIFCGKEAKYYVYISKSY